MYQDHPQVDDRPHGDDRSWYDPPLLRSKLAAPAPPGGLVTRPRLHDLLDAGTRGPLTALVAPAGWGKTVLLDAWSRQRAGQRGPAGWLTLEADDTGARFWRYLHAALGGAGVSVPLPDPDDPGYLTDLAVRLAGLPEPAVVILDDFHHLRDPAALDGLAYLLRHAASGLRLIAATRIDPALPLHRLRLRDELTELRAGELSFTAEETAAVLAEHGLALPAEAADALQAHTEGWPAGVRFAALSLQRYPDPARFAGHLTDDATVAEYLIGEVLADQPPAIQEAMADTSILQRLCGGLVDAVTGRDDGDRVLAELARTNTFVVPLQDGPQWYRYHRMFGELLRARLHHRAPERISTLHRRAARWYAAQDQPVDALRHALAAQDWGYATRLLVDDWHRLARYGHDEPLPAPVEPPPPDAIRAEPELALACAADRLDLRDLDAAEGYLRLADRHRHLLDDRRRDRFALITTALELAQAQQRGDATRARRAATSMLDLLGQPPGADVAPPDGAAVAPADGTTVATTTGPATATATGPATATATGPAAVALAALGTADLTAGDLAAAEANLRDGLSRAEAAGLSCPRLVCASTLAFVQALRGELRAAERTAHQALALPPCLGQSRAVHRGFAYLALAVVHLERDRLEQARGELDFAAAACEPASEPSLAGAISAVTGWLMREQGDLAGAYEALAAGRRELAERPPSPMLRRWFAAIDADLRAEQGIEGPAATWGRTGTVACDDDAGADPAFAVALARTHLRDGDTGAALRALPRWRDDDTGTPLPVRLAAGLVEALSVRRDGDTRRATRTLEQVLRMAEPDGYRRVFTRAGAPARDLLVEHLDSGTAYWSLVNDLVAAARPTQPAGDASPRVATALAEPLTERELTVLRYLQSILSNTEIAVEMSLSVNTVKTHVRNIYRKLDTARRRDAVRRARELHLL